MSDEAKKYGRDVAETATSYEDAMVFKKLVLKPSKEKDEDNGKKGS